MNNTKTLGIPAVVAILVTLFVGTFVLKPDTIVNNIPTPLGGVNPVFASPFLQWGGVNMWNARSSSLASASNVLCSIAAPAATSTLISAAFDIEVSTSSSYILTMGKGTVQSGAGATSTVLIEGGNIASGAKTSLVYVASSTSQTAISNGIFAPGTYLNYAVRGGSSGVTYGFTMGDGHCSAVWQQIAY